jgi:alpha-L-arabinofuranosidase
LARLWIKRGALRPIIKAPLYSSIDYDEIPLVDAAVVLGDDGSLNIFVMNRASENAIELPAIYGRLEIFVSRSISSFTMIMLKQLIQKLNQTKSSQWFSMTMDQRTEFFYSTACFKLECPEVFRKLDPDRSVTKAALGRSIPGTNILLCPLAP